jgi:hypothetical protein
LFQLPQSVHRLLVAPSGLAGSLTLAGAALSGMLALLGSCLLALETKR